MKLKIRLLIVGCFLSIGAFAQTPKAIEDDLLATFKKIDYWNIQKANDTTVGALDSLSDANDYFSDKLSEYAVKKPLTIKLPFEYLTAAGLEITTSDDGNLRIYSWDSGTGGMQHTFRNIFQFRTKYGTDTLHDVTADPYPTPADISNIYQFIINGKTIYLINYVMPIGINCYEGITVCTVENEHLNTDVKIIKTKSGLHNHLSCYFEGSTNNGEDVNTQITFDPKNNTIKLPLINENNQPTKYSITYKFTGQYFEKVK